jgi:hypothetical protein
MKKYVTLLLVLVLAAPALARDETLLGDDIESGGYGALVVKYGRIMDTDGVFVGGQGGWIINHSLVIGVGGYGLANQIEVDGSECIYLGFGYGGLLLEFIVASSKLVHFSVSGLIGAGGVGDYDDESCDFDQKCKDDAFFALEPGANLMLNVHKYVRVGLGATYRYVDGVRFEGLTDSDLSGATAQFIIKFGAF